MQNLSDNELDKRFKDAADGFRPAFDPEAWQGMEQKLDREAGGNQNGLGGMIGRYIPFVLIFLTGSVTGILTWNQFTRNDKSTSNIAIQTQPVQTQTDGGTAVRESSDATQQANVGAESDSRLADPVDSPKTNQKGENQNAVARPEGDQTTTRRLHVPSKSGTIQTSTAKTAPGGREQHAGVTNLLTTSQPTTSGLDNTNSTAVSESDELRNGNVNVSSTESAGTKEITLRDESVLPGNTDPNKSRNAMPQDELQERQNNLSVGVGFGDNTGDSTQQIVQPEKAELARNDSEDRKEDQQEAAPLRNRMSVVAAISPDFSSVNFSSHTRPGINAGLLIEYHFNPRISIQSGAILSQKVYSARDLEYNGYTAETADGDCRIIDIPVNVNYRFPSRGNYSLYVSAGFSSYLMKKEDYTFVIDSYNGPYEYSRSVRNENNELFKVVNLSAGLSRKLSHRFFLEAEPFVKLPVSGIGDGKLSVNSIGLFVRLRYSFLQIQ